MKRHFSPFAQSLFLALMAASTIATAATAAGGAKAAKPDAAKGEALYISGDAARGIPACVSCHGDKGNSTIGMNPKLAGQHAQYLGKQLHDFTKPDRNNAVMTTIAKAMSPTDITNVSAYLSVQASKPGAAKNKDTVEIGKKIYRGGIPEKNVPACASCHGPAGSGMPAQYPRLAGQSFEYTSAQLTAFVKLRKNSVQMTEIAKRMSEDDMKAVADYVAGLK